MRESFGESVLFSVIQGFFVFAIGYLVWGLVDSATASASYMVFIGACWAFGALIGRRVARRGQ